MVHKKQKKIIIIIITCLRLLQFETKRFFPDLIQSLLLVSTPQFTRRSDFYMKQHAACRKKKTFCRDGLRHSECTSSWKTHHTQCIQQRGKQGQLALKRCWRARDLLNGELLTKEGKREWLLKECLAFCASSPPSVNIKSPHGSFLISFHIPQKPREPRPLSAPIFHSM